MDEAATATVDLAVDRLGGDVWAWADQDDREAAERVMAALHPDLVELCRDLGVLYALEQATQAVEAALHLANPNASPSRWRRRDPGLAPQELLEDPAATFRSACVHALLDNAGVPTIGPATRACGSIPQRAALRLQRADVHDAVDVARWLGLPVSEVDRLWGEGAAALTASTASSGDATVTSVPGPLARRLAARAAAVTGVGTGLVAATSAVAVAASAAVIGLAATGVALSRSTAPAPSTLAPVVVPGDDVPARDVVDPSEVPGGDDGVPADLVPAGGEPEGVEAPFLPGEERPGLNVPVGEVTIFELDDLDLPSTGELVPLSPDEVLPETVLPTELLPTEIVPSEVASIVDGVVEQIEDLLPG